MNPLLTVDEAAAFLRIKRTTLYTWAYRHQIPTQKVGRALRFPARRFRDLATMPV